MGEREAAGSSVRIGPKDSFIRMRPMPWLGMPMAAAAFWESIARRPGESRLAAIRTRIVLPFSRFVTSTTVLEG
ncbi:hypothetical protein AGMMS49940_15130 [Spirochaetia bacterium]|nr:hypothetical protein AGMMS49940_15130 [Spirochaetia bacterium]